MTRKDTILIAVVINAALLSILFTTAMIYDTDKPGEQTEYLANLSEGQLTDGNSSVSQAPVSGGDEVDNVLTYYANPSSEMIAMGTHSEFIPDPIAVPASLIEEESNDSPDTREKYAEVKVKKGDVLSKIARDNGTTTSELKRLNHLQNERLAIGQVLKVPVSPSPSSRESSGNVPRETAREGDPANAVYYVVKQGDNPWKIAKQFNIDTEDILRLNRLDEEKARNMKVGDRIRVK